MLEADVAAPVWLVAAEVSDVVPEVVPAEHAARTTTQARGRTNAAHERGGIVRGLVMSGA
jgi:hypothetical protein